ncbi:hypothetical protein MMC30_006040 [Trapelia coarctata]|nr:hypothetical protein [Trapelia coarctata]
MSAKSPKRPADVLEDSDWEYEYDDVETESFYVTLDLSSAPLTRASKKPRTDGANGNGKESSAPTVPTNAAAQTPQATEAIDTLDPEDRIQILDLHSSNPVISYQNHVYSCQWTSTLGTDILLTPPHLPPPFRPLHSDPGFNVLATPSIKLVGQPVQMVQHSRGRVEPSVAAPAASSITPTIIAPVEASNTYPIGSAPDSAPTTIPKPIHIPVPPTAPRSKQNQARFLERLIAVKAAKGEPDNVTVHSRRRLTGTGWRSWRDQAAPDGSGIQRPERLTNLVPIPTTEGEGGQEDDEGEDSLGRFTRDGVPRKRIGRPPGSVTRSDKRKITRLGKAGGLFRDYRPAPGDEEGADIRGGGGGGGMVGRTPGTWDGLVGREGSGEGAAGVENVEIGGGEGSGSRRRETEDVIVGINTDQGEAVGGNVENTDVTMEDVG